MAMKMFKKSKLQYKDGYIVKDGKVLGIDNEIVDMFNKLEKDYQHACWKKAHPVCVCAPTEEFQFETERGNVIPHAEANTPMLDKMVKDAEKLMDELDDVAYAYKINNYFDSIQPLVQFVYDKRVVCSDQVNQHRFDLKYIGNPLELDTDALGIIVKRICEE